MIRLLRDDVRCQRIDDLIHATCVRVNVQIDRLAEVQGEDTHDGLCIDYIAAWYEVEVNVSELHELINKRLYFIDRIKRDTNGFHDLVLLKNIIHSSD